MILLRLPILLFYRLFLWLIGWRLRGKLPNSIGKYVVLVVPHTSNWDFILTVAARPWLGLRHSRFLAKKSLFDSPLGFLFYALGGTPVDRSKNSNLVEQVAEKFAAHEKYGVAVTPEGTRSYIDKWKTGFYYIAKGANVPFILGYVDYRKRVVGIGEEAIWPSENFEDDLAKIQDFYQDKIPLYPENSTVHRGRGIKKPRLLNPFKTAFKSILLLVTLFLALNYQLTHYGIKQGYGQLKILYEAKPIEAFLEDETFPDSLKQKIHLVQEIKQFAFDSIGLDHSNSYSKLYNQKGEPILWVVTACEPFRLVNKEWDFPVLGRMSYKGYFDKEAVMEEEVKLRKSGWDTRVREVNAWSTLGILNDPILSNMLYRSEGYLAEVVIHELTHGTLFIRDNLQYNENLADFIGEEGAVRFLKHKFGEGSPQYQAYMNAQPDYETFTQYVLESTQKLDALYKSFGEDIPESEKREKKDAFIDGFINGLQSLDFKNKRYYKIFDGNRPNNAFFMAYLRYRGEKNKFREQFEKEFNSDFKAYFAYLKSQYSSIF